MPGSAEESVDLQFGNNPSRVLEGLSCDIGGTSVSNLVSHGVGHHDRFGNDLKKVEQSSSRQIDERGRVDSRKLSHDLSRA